MDLSLARAMAGFRRTSPLRRRRATSSRTIPGHSMPHWPSSSMVEPGPSAHGMRPSARSSGGSVLGGQEAVTLYAQLNGVAGEYGGLEPSPGLKEKE